ncbi:LysR family transcriptional regulator [Pseudomonas sp. dw_358]|uniref:LysR family transcriptional regulator n=1 Tax=Pseudomonas sp. dw_358 TaxID=2720083 RepID=UPI001BD3704D|nr:LysR family transcriptional regulator [Pseudomonas sp. dw_358]
MTHPRTVDLVLLRSFVAIARSGSISAAARHLHLTQGGISQQVKRLEAFFGCQLLDRDPAGTRLTDRGRDFLPKARRLLDLNDSLCGEMIGPALPETVRVGVPHDMGGSHFAPVLKVFAQQHPDVEVIVVSGSSVDLMNDFSKGLIDLTISQCPEDEGVGERLSLEPLVWIGHSQQLCIQRPLPLCFITPTCTFRRTVFSRLGEVDISWRVIFENASVDTTLATVKSGLALTPWLRSLVPDDFQMLGTDSGLPLLPDFAIELHVSPTAAQGALAMAEIIRSHGLPNTSS